jgi:hypothetical protein
MEWKTRKRSDEGCAPARQGYGAATPPVTVMPPKANAPRVSARATADELQRSSHRPARSRPDTCHAIGTAMPTRRH